MASRLFRSLARSLFAGSAFIGVMGAAALAAETALHHRIADATLLWGPCPAFMPKGCELALLHGNPTQPNSDIFFRIPAKAEIPKHWHTSAERMILVEGELQVSYAGQAPVTLRPGSYAYGPPKAPHSALCRSTTPCVLFIAFDGPIDAHQNH
jgi:mannose-6-phosphate isomerase-like protein (cupin superfamily)